MSDSKSTPMSEETRAALNKRVAELKALQARQAGGAPANPSAAQVPASQPWSTHPQQQQQQQQQQPVAQYGYDDEDNEYGDASGWGSGAGALDWSQYQGWSAPSSGNNNNTYKSGGGYGGHRHPAAAAAAGAMDDDYDDDDVMDDAEAAKEAFFDQMEQMHAHHFVPRPADPAPSTHARHVVGDFEVFRLAKMGDSQSCFEFATMTGVDLATFVDNAERNALHYAADSGSVALVKALLERDVPFKADALGLTPLDIALLSSGSDAPSSSALIETLLSAAAAVSTLTPEQKSVRSVEALCGVFAPKPPGFVMAKPAPSAPIATHRRSFWTGEKSAQQPGSDAGDVTTTVPASEAGAALSATALVDLVGTLSDNSATPEARNAWLMPLEEPVVQSLWQPSTLITTHHAMSSSGPDSGVDGVVLSRLTGGSVQGFSASLKRYTAANLACASALAVASPQRGTGLTARLMRSAQKALSEAGCEAVAFVTPAQLSSPPNAVCMIKWLRRVIEPTNVFREQAYAESVFPEFFREDQSLRATAVLKGHVTKALFEAREAALHGWGPVSADNDVQVDLVLTFLQSKTGPATGVELAYVPTDSDGLRRGLLAQGLFPYARVVDDAVTDFVVFRPRVPRASEVRDAAVILDLVYAAFTSLKGVEKSEHILLLAQHLHKADVLYVPNMFGFADSDLVKAHFEEEIHHREWLYIADPRAAPAVKSPVPPTPASKVALPIFVS